MWKVVEVDQGTVDSYRAAGALDAVLGNQSEFRCGPLAALSQESLKGAADGHFMIDVELAELAESFVVGLDGGVRRLES